MLWPREEILDNNIMQAKKEKLCCSYTKPHVSTIQLGTKRIMNEKIRELIFALWKGFVVISLMCRVYKSQSEKTNLSRCMSAQQYKRYLLKTWVPIPPSAGFFFYLLFLRYHSVVVHQGGATLPIFSWNMLSHAAWGKASILQKNKIIK